MRSRNYINHRDELGETALSIAVKASEPALVHALLEHDASAVLTDKDGTPPLHNAISSRTPKDICELLLTHNADANVTSRTGNQTNTALSLTVTRLERRSKAEEPGCDELFDLIALLINAGAGWSSSDLRTAVKAFTRCWITTSGSLQLLHSARPIIKSYLALGQDPTTSFAYDRYDCSRRSLAHCAFSHGPHRALADLLSQLTAPSKLQALTVYALSSVPCPRDTSRILDLTDVFKDLLARVDDETYVTRAPQFAQTILTYTSVSRTLPLLKVLTEQRDALAHHIVSDVADEVLEALGTYSLRNSDQQWDVAEVILCPQMRPSYTSQLAILMGRIYSMLMRSEERIDMDEFKEASTWLDPPITRVEGEVRRCILHVVTRAVVERLALEPITPKTRLRKVFNLRSIYSLPAFEITSELLFRALDILHWRAGQIIGLQTHARESSPRCKVSILP